MNYGTKSNEKRDDGADLETHNKYKEIIATLPRSNRHHWIVDLYQYEGFWFPLQPLEGLLLAQDCFMPQPNDALNFAILTRSSFGESTNPLLSRLSHDCVPFLELEIVSNPQNFNSNISLVATHIPYTSLPKSIISSGCKIIYIFRDPKDVIVSSWHFSKKLSHEGVQTSTMEDLDLKEAFELFCEGASIAGPYWNHVLGILFIKYEDLTNETIHYVKKMNEFMGYPFSLEEEVNGVVQNIINLRSFENLSSLEVNQSGPMQFLSGIVGENNAFFRKGKVGDWKNHLTPKMVTRLDQINKQKLSSLGLTLHVSANA
ncbi:hypothetical protein ACJW30_04G092900 [Castanea mollissima]